MRQGDNEPPSYSTEQLNEKVMNQLWPQTSQEQWQDWRWQMANRLRSLDRLAEVLSLSPNQVSKYRKLTALYPFAITPYYFSLINWDDPEDPIRKQCLPDLKEIDPGLSGSDDPLEEEKDMPVPNLVHRYPDRVLAIVTNTCSMYCRHCTRKRIWKSGEYACSRLDLQKMVEYIKNTKNVREVIISGGDPLIMNPDLLNGFLSELRKIQHVDVIRIGTRVPVVLPMRITDELVAVLKRHRPLWVNTQFNHKQEITLEAQEACNKLQLAGIPVSNQTVLLKGINDSVEAMLDLNHALQRIMVRPYYLFQCDPVAGVDHFRTNVLKGLEIIEAMRGHTGGMCIPTFVVDAPGGGGKIPLQPFYLLSASPQEVMLRNYEGMIVVCENPQESAERSRRSAGKQPQLLKSNAVPGTRIVAPLQSERWQRRRARGG